MAGTRRAGRRARPELSSGPPARAVTFGIIATGPHAGRKALTLHTVASYPPTNNPCIAELSGCSLHSPPEWCNRGPPRAAKPMSATPSNAWAATSPAQRSPTNASRSMTAARSCIDSSTPSVTERLMSCSTPSTSSPASPPLKCRSRSELALCHDRAPISSVITACSPRTSSTVTASSPTPPIKPPASLLRLVHPPCAGCSGPTASSISTSSAVRCVALRCGSSRASTRPRASRQSSLISPCAKPTASTTRAHHRGVRPQPNSRSPRHRPCAECARGGASASLRLTTQPPRFAPTLPCSRRCRTRIASARPQNIRAQTANEPDNDHTNTPTTTQSGRLFHLSVPPTSRSYCLSAVKPRTSAPFAVVPPMSNDSRSGNPSWRP